MRQEGLGAGAAHVAAGPKATGRQVEDAPDSCQRSQKRPRHSNNPRLSERRSSPERGAQRLAHRWRVLLAASMLLQLMVVAILVCTEARKATRPTAERPTIGDAMEWRVPWNSNYLRDEQAVGIIRPHSGERIWKGKQFIGSKPRTRGLVWQLKGENKPLKRLRGRRPFKVRILHMDPMAIFGKLVAEERVDIAPFAVPDGEYKGRIAVGVRLRKPKPWYRRAQRYSPFFTPSLHLPFPPNTSCAGASCECLDPGGKRARFRTHVTHGGCRDGVSPRCMHPVRPHPSGVALRGRSLLVLHVH